jgi:hypothetical protein
MEEKFLTTEEVAERLRTSPATVRYWRLMGTGPLGFRCGRRVLYAEKSLEAFVQGLMHSEGAA